MPLLTIFRTAVLLGAASLPIFASASSTPREAALSAYRSGKPAQALAMLDEQLASNPRDPQLLLLKGVVLADIGRGKEARAIFQNLIVDHPSLPEPYNNLAVLYAAEGDFEKAKTVLEMAIKTNPSYATAYENLGDVYAKLASESYARALNLQPRKELQPKLRLINQVVALTPAPASASISSSTAATPSPNNPSRDSLTPPSSSASFPAQSPASTRAGKDDKVDDAVLQEARQAIERWRQAWSSRDIQTYIDSYVPGYSPGKGVTHQQWVNERTSRIVPRKHIEVEISDLQMRTRPDGTLQARFLQHYRSDALDNRTRKELILTQQNGRWLIASERSF